MKLRLIQILTLLCLSAGFASAQVPFALTSSPNPSAVNQSVLLTATGTFSGTTVTFKDGGANGTVLGQSSANFSGTATFSTSSLTAGLHTLAACFFNDSSSPTCTTHDHIVTSPTNLSLTSSANPSGLCQAVTFTATLTPATATGTITFFDGNAALTTVGVTNGAATFTSSSLSLGNHIIQARYNPDPGYGGSSALVNQLITGAVSVTLNSAPNPSNFQQTVTITATVAAAPCSTAPPPSSPPTGTVTFFDGSTQLGNGTISNGTATFSTSTLAIGSHNLDAHYNGDANYASNDSNIVVHVVGPATKINTNTALSVSANPINSGQAVVLTASVTAASSTTQTITGQVQFRDGSTVIGTSNVSNGSATFNATGLAVGTHPLSAFYVGDNNFNSSTSSTVNEVVNQPSTPTTTQLSVTPNPANAGQSVSMTAVVTPSSATGTVQFLDGGSQIGSANLTGGVAVFSTTSLAAGSHTLTARYGGDNTNQASTSNAVTLLVNGQKQNTTTSISVSSNPITSGQSLTISANVSPSGATGTVQFTDGGSPIGTANVNGGVAQITTSTLSVGTHILAASYSGDTNFNPSNSNTITETVNSATNPTTTSLSVTPNPSVFGQNVAFTASVTGTGGTPSGTVTFLDGSTPLSTINLTNGSATFSTSTLSPGAHSITASYSGGGNFNASTSNPTLLTVNKATTTTVLTATPAAASPGQTITLTAKVTSAASGNITGTVTFRDGNTTLGTPIQLPANGTGTVTITTSTLTNGSHTLTAVYSGDDNYLTSTSTQVPVSVGLTQTTTTLTSNPTAPTLGQNVTFTATVAPATATGTVTFLDGATSLGTGTLASGTATFSTSTLGAGAHSITAVYGGDTTFGTSTSAAVTFTITKATTTTVLTATPNPGTVGQPVALRAVVTPATATGNVTFLDGGTTLGTAPLTGGAATFTANNLTQGNHTLTASYAGDANNNASTSAAVTLAVNPGGTPPTNIQPATLPNGIVGVPYSQTFTVSGGTGTLTWTLVTGSVPGLTLSPGGVLSGTPTTAGTTALSIRVTDANGQATAVGPTNLVIVAPPAPALTAPVFTAVSTQAPTVALSQPFAQGLTATFSLSFTPDASVKNLPANFPNKPLQFSSGGTTTGNISIPANSTAAVNLPLVQVGSVAGTVTIRLATLVTAGGQSVLPGNAVVATITVPTGPPVITPNSVKITNITSTGFSVTLTGTSPTRELTAANLTFTAASGTTLNGTTANVPLTAAANAWFADAGTNRGVDNGGAFSLTLPFNYSGDTAAIGTVSVTLSNSATPGTSAAVSGGK